jgi:hypothetical protein
MTPTPPQETPALTPETLAQHADELDQHADKLESTSAFGSLVTERNLVITELRKLAARIRGML